MKIKLPVFMVFVFGFSVYGRSQADRVSIVPAYPKRGDTVTVTYHPLLDTTGNARKQDAVQLVFSYSNLYELPWKIALHKSGEDWTTSFVIPRYGVYATFYLQNGDWVDRPSAFAHYAIVVYDQHRQRVENGYLYNGYSLSAQMGKVAGVKEAQKAMYEEELKHFPDNYEARLRLLSTALNAGRSPEEEQQAKEKGNEIIAARFYSDPYKMGNINKVTMGYLIMGENERLDSIRNVIRERYPKGTAGIELRAGDISRLENDREKLAKLKQLLNEKTAENEEAYSGIHDMLFEYYAQHRNSKEALRHARSMLALEARQESPYLPVSYKHIAETLLENGLALDSAASYAERALAMSDNFPVGLIRYFPETGFIPSFVSDRDRLAGSNKAKGNMLSLISLIQLARQKKAEAAGAMEKALTYSKDNETLVRAIRFYEKTANHPQAADAAWNILMLAPNDTMALSALKRNESAADLPGRMAELDKIWTERMKISLNKERVNKKAPVLQGLLDMDGKPVPVSFLENKVIVLNFWATWCVPCMEEMPYMQKVYTQYKNDPDVVFLVTNSASRNTLQDAKKWADRKKYDFPVYFASEPKLTEALGFELIPATFIIDRKGWIQFKLIGFEGATIEKKVSVAIDLLGGS